MSLAAKFFLIAFTVLLLSSCKIEGEENKNPNLSTDTPLSEFIIGRWKYEGKYHYGNSASDISWEYTFVDEKVIKIWTGDDGGTCTYEFIEPEMISIDCSPRMMDKMKWSIKRDSQFLLIQRLETEQSKGGEQLKFERVADREGIE